jgi:hypothetical protein
MSKERTLLHKKDRQTTSHIVYLSEVRYKRAAIFKI